LNAAHLAVDVEKMFGVFGTVSDVNQKTMVVLQIEHPVLTVLLEEGI